MIRHLVLGAAFCAAFGAQAAQRDRFSAVDGGLVRDAKTKLLWTANDGGVDLTWRDAQQYCAAKGEGWRLPTLVEISALYDPRRSSPCGLSTCHIVAPFHLTETYFWTSDSVGDDTESFDFGDGTHAAIFNGLSHHRHVLCVVKPKAEREGPALKH